MNAFDVFWITVKFIFRMNWRYFTGHHMDGRHRKVGRTGTVLPKYHNYFWNRYSRPQRAMWRHLVFWSAVTIAYGIAVDRGLTMYAILAVLPFLGWQVCRKVANLVSMKVKFLDSDGVSQEYRILRPKVEKWLRRKRLPKLRRKLPDGGPVPPELYKAILAANAEEGNEPVTNIRQISTAQGEVLEPPKDKRSRTIRRKDRWKTS